MLGWLFFTFVAQPAPVSGVRIAEPFAPATKIDILLDQPAAKCEAQSAEEIIVCASTTDNESQRLRPITNEQIYDRDETRAEFDVSENIRMVADIGSNQLGGGVVSKAVMARVKIRF